MIGLRTACGTPLFVYAHRELTAPEMALHQQQGWRDEPCCDPSHGEGHLSGRCTVCGKRTSYAYEDKVPQQRAAALPPYQAPTQPIRVHRGVGIIMTHAMRVLEAAGSFQFKEMIPGDLDWLEKGGNPAAYLPEQPSGKWYHTSPYEMKPGDRIVPRGAPSPGGEGEWSFYREKGKANRPNHVWLSRNPDEAKWWRNWAGHGAHIYEVKPGDRPQPWNLSGGQGWVAPHATVIRKVDVGPHTYWDSLIPPEERVAQSYAPYYIDESPWYSAVWDEDLDEDDEEQQRREREHKPEVMLRKRLSQLGVEPDMNVRKQLNKFTDRIYRARQNGDHAVADYYEHLRDMMLADVEAGVPKPFSYYEPRVSEEFDD